DARRHALTLRFGLTHSHVGERGVREHAIRHEPIARAAATSGEIISDDPKIVLRDMRELWTTRAFPNGPHPWRTRLKPLIDTNISAIVQLDAGLLKSDPGRVGHAPGCDENIAALDGTLAGLRSHDNAYVLSA